MERLTQPDFDAALQGGRTDFTGCDLSGLVILGTFKPFLFDHAILDGAFVNTTVCGLSGASFAGAVIMGLSVTTGAPAEGVSFRGARIGHMHLDGVALTNPDFTGSRLIGQLTASRDTTVLRPVFTDAAVGSILMTRTSEMVSAIDLEAVRAIHVLDRSAMKWCGPVTAACHRVSHHTTIIGTRFIDPDAPSGTPTGWQDYDGILHPDPDFHRTEFRTRVALDGLAIQGFPAAADFQGGLSIRGTQLRWSNNTAIQAHGLDATGALISSRFDACQFPGADLTGALINGAAFYDTDLAGSVWDGVIADQVAFHGTDLSGADTSGATFIACTFNGTPAPPDARLVGCTIT